MRNKPSHIFIAAAGLVFAFLIFVSFGMHAQGASLTDIHILSGSGTEIIGDNANTLDIVTTSTIGGAINISTRGTSGGIFIDTAGNIGFGTTTPAVKLHVIGTSTVSGNLNVEGAILGTFTGTNSGATLAASVRGNGGVFGSAYDAVGTNYRFNNATNTALLFIDATNSRIGVGTASPADLVNIYDSRNSGTITSLRVQGVSTGAWTGRIVAGGPTVAFLMGEYQTKAWLGAHNAALSAWSDFYINPDGLYKLYLGGPNASGPIVTVDNATRNVGIGTTTPNVPLAVQDTTGRLLSVGRVNTGAAISLNTSLTSGPRITMESGRYGLYGVSQIKGTLSNDDGATAPIVVQTEGVSAQKLLSGIQGANGEVFNVSNSGGAYFAGNVGMGTTTPGAKLHIAAPVTGSKLILEDSYTANGKWGLAVGIVSVDDISFRLRYESGNLDVIRASTNGNVGIGSSSPSTARLVITPGAQPSIDAGSQRIINVATPTANNDAANKTYVDSAISTATSSGVWTTSGTNIYNSNAGNVGIGTTTAPAYKFSVNGTFSADTGNIYSDGAGNLSAVSFLDKANPVYFLDPSAATSMKTAGNVGIGMSGTPGEKLDVIGNIAFGSATANNTWRPILGGSNGVYPQPYLALPVADTTMTRINIMQKGDTMSDATHLITGFSGPTVNVWNGGATRFLALNSAGIQSSDNGIISINQNGGNVGIGTTTPSNTLQVAGDIGLNGSIKNASGDLRITSPSNIRLYSTGNASVIVRNSSDTGNLWSVNGSGDVSFGATGVWNSAGNVGIGTTTPATNLSVVGSSTISGNLAVGGNITGTFTGTNSGATLASSVRGNGGVFGSSYDAAGTNYRFNDATNTALLYVDATNGRLGVGTATPSTKISVLRADAELYGTGNSVDNLYNPSGTVLGFGSAAPSGQSRVGRATLIHLVVGDATNADGAYIGAVGQSASSAAGANLVFGRRTANSTWAETMRINTSGNVGIGNANPTQKLQIGATTSLSTATPDTVTLGGTFSSTAGSNVKLRVYDDGTTNVGGINVSSGQLEVNTWPTGKIAFYRGTTQSMIIDTDGDLGINNSLPAYKLDVTGDINASGTLRVSGQSTDLRYPKVYRSGATVTAGNIKPIAYFYAGEGTVSVLIQVQSITGGNSGTKTYQFQGGYSQLTTNWYKMQPLTLGRGHGESTNGFDVYVRQSASLYGYDFGIAANTTNKTLYATFQDLTGGSLTYADLSASAEVAQSSAGDVYSQRAANFEGQIGIGTTTPTTAKLVIVPGAQPSIDAGSQRIINVATPITNNDAANKTYVDSAISTATSSGVWVTSGTNIYNANSGNVGVGTTTAPAYKFSVNGTFAADAGNVYSDGTGNLSAVSFLDKTNPSYFLDPSATVSMKTAGTVNIGGTGAPVAQLDIKGPLTANNSSLLLKNGNDSGGGQNSPQIMFGYSNNSTYPHFIRTRHNAATTTNNAIDFYTGDGTSAGVFPTNATLTLSLNGGNVGVGTASPQAKLDVAGKIVTSGDFNQVASGNNGINLMSNANGSTISFKRSAVAHGALNFDGSYFKFAPITYEYDPTSVGTPVMVVGLNGHVGVGTSTPTSDLTVVGTSTVVGNLAVTGNITGTFTGTNSGATLATSVRGNGGVFGSAYDAAGTNYRFNDATNTALLYVDATNGRVGVGTASPTTKLDIIASNYNDALKIGSGGGNSFTIGRNLSDGAAVFDGGTGSTLFKFSNLGTQYAKLDSTGISVGTAATPFAGVSTDKAISYWGLNSSFASTIAADSYIVLRNANNGYKIAIGNNGNGDTIFYNQSANTNFVAADEKMRITGTGNVGIGTSTPAEKLTVIGNMQFGATPSFKSTDGGFTFTNSGTNVGTNLYVKPSGTGTTAAMLLFSDSAGTNLSRLEITQTSLDTIIRQQPIGTGTNGTIYIQHAGADEFKIDPSGYIHMGQKQIINLTRTMPTVVDSTVDIGSLGSQYSHSVRMTINVNDSGFSVAKTYELTSMYGQTGGTWYVVPAISDSGAYSGNNYQLEVNQAGATLTMRIRRTAGSTVGTALISMDYSGHTGTVFTPSTATASGVATVSIPYPTTVITQTGNNVGLGTLSPTTARLVINPGAQPSIDAGSQRIINVATPTSNNDAVNKTYVDSAILAATSSTSQWTTSGANIYNSNAGNVGIGTTTAPAYKFSVNGTFGADTGNIYSDGAGNLSAISFLDKANPVYFLDPSAATSMKTAGNVGLGMSGTPVARLHVVGAGASTVTNSQIVRIDGGITHGLDFGTLTGAPFTWWIQSRDNTVPASTYPLALNPSGGNVGIGTTTPSYPLDVAGIITSNRTVYSDQNSENGFRIKVQDYGGTANDAGIGIESNAGPMWFNNVNGGGFKFIDGTGGTRVTITSGGSVGIGTTTPATALHVIGSSTISGNLAVGGNITGTFTGTNSGATLATSVRGNGGVFGSSYDAVGTNYRFNDATNTALLFVDAVNSRIGVRTAVPSATFNVNGNGLVTQTFYVDAGNMGTTQTLFEHTGASTPVPFRMMKSGYVGAGTTYGILELAMNDNTVDNGANLYFQLKDSAGNLEEYAGLGGRIVANTNGAERGQLYFYTMDDGVGRSPKMVISPDGNVGIGNTNPVQKLQIGTTSSASTATPDTLSLGGLYSSTAGANVKMRVYDDGTSVGGMSVSANQMEVNTWAAGKLAFYRGTTQSMMIDTNGYLGIGTSTPSERLTVSGNIELDMGASATNYIRTPAGQDLILEFGSNANPGYGVRTVKYSVQGGGYARVDYGGGGTYQYDGYGSQIHMGYSGMFFTNGGGNGGIYAMTLTSANGIVLSGGNVSIGTTASTTAKLIISPGAQPSIDAGSQRIINVATPTSNNDAVNKTYVDSAILAATSSNVWTTSGANIYNSNSGNVGIGTTTAPAYKLSVNGSFGADAGNIYSDGVGNLSAVSFYDKNSPTYFLDPSAATSMKTAGSVGIAMSGAPAYTLDVAGNMRATTGLVVDAGSGSSNATLTLTGRNGGTGSSATIYSNFTGGISINPGTTPMVGIALNPSGGATFQVGGNASIGYAVNQSAPTNGLVVNGNVAIGTTTASTALSVNGTLTLLSGGNLSMTGNITSVNKLTVAAIDPLYEINGKKYSTYAASIAGGVKEEFVGRGKLIADNEEGIATYTIDFSQVEEGSDLWVWYNAVDFSRDNIEVFANSYGVPVAIAYEVEGSTIIFRSLVPNTHSLTSNAIEFSYRLIGKRHDWRSWPTLAPDQKERPSFTIPSR